MLAGPITRPLTSRITSPLGYPERWGLTAHWRLGDLTDAVGGNTLTNVNSVTFGSGKLGNAAVFSAATQALRVASNASIQAASLATWFGGWVNLGSKTADRYVFSKATSSGGFKAEYFLRYDSTGDRFYFEVWKSGPVFGGGVAANTLGSPAVSTEYFVLCWHDAVAGRLGISVNGIRDTVSYTDGVATSAFGLQLGSQVDNGTAIGLIGQLDSWSFGRNPPVGIDVAVREIESRAYAKGAGRDFPWS